MLSPDEQVGVCPLPPAASSVRRVDIDWVRALAVLLLVPYHSTLVFGPPHAYHIATGEDYRPLMYAAGIMHQWHMPLLFVIAGVSTWFALNVRTPGQYTKERAIRLVVPLVFGTLLIVPPQMYFQRVSEGRFSGSYLSFYPHFFDGVYPTGNFTYNHLWFILYLFVFSMLALPVLVRLRTGAGRQLLARLGGVCDRRGGIFLMAIPVAVSESLLRARYPGLQTLIGDWANFALYLYLFVLGYILCGDERFWAAVARDGGLALVCGVAATLVGVGISLMDANPSPGYSAGWMLYMTLRAFNMWFWIVAILSGGMRFLNVTTSWLSYVREASYPFYILHQTVLIAIGFYVMRWDLPVMSRYAILVAATIVTTTVIYDVAVRRLAVTRFVMGMRPRRR
jgi:glucan biosynthesis protein C